MVMSVEPHIYNAKMSSEALAVLKPQMDLHMKVPNQMDAADYPFIRNDHGFNVNSRMIDFFLNM